MQCDSSATVSSVQLEDYSDCSFCVMQAHMPHSGPLQENPIRWKGLVVNTIAKTLGSGYKLVLTSENVAKDETCSLTKCQLVLELLEYCRQFLLIQTLISA